MSSGASTALSPPSERDTAFTWGTRLVGQYQQDRNRIIGKILTSTDTGSANAYVLTPSPAITYASAFLIWFVAANTNTGASTANVSGKGALNIYRDTESGPVALTGGEIIGGNWCGLGFDSALNSGAGGFHLLNPQQQFPTQTILGNNTAGAGGATALTADQTKALLGGTLAQAPVVFETGAVATGTTTVTFNDTIPTNTAGNQFMSATITPKNASSKLIIDVVFIGAYSIASSQIALMLFQDATANAIAAAVGNSGTTSGFFVFSFRHVMTAGTTSATTFKLRAGSNGGGTLTFNGNAGTRFFGGVLASSITIAEILP